MSTIEDDVIMEQETVSHTSIKDTDLTTHLAALKALILATPSDNTSKLDLIRKQLSDGTYDTDPLRIAEKMMA